MIYIPKKNKEYFYISYRGDIAKDFYDDSPRSIGRIKSGNCYRTDEEAARARDRDYALRELQILIDTDSKEDAYDIVLSNMLEPPNYIDDALNKLGKEKVDLIFGYYKE